MEMRAKGMRRHMWQEFAHVGRRQTCSCQVRNGYLCAVVMLCSFHWNAGEFELQPGITQLTPLRELEVHGNVASLGDLWQHTGLTRLALVECDRPILGPTHSGPSLPALLEASLGTDMREMVPPEHGFFQALSNVTYLVRHLLRD